MIREEYALFLNGLKNVLNKGGDVDAYIKQYENRNVYFYNDACIKKILASEKNLMLTTDLINAALNLVGSDRIENPKLVNPYVPGELGRRSIEPDLLLTNVRGVKSRVTVFRLKSSMKITNLCTAIVWFSALPALRTTWCQKGLFLNWRTCM